MLETYIQLKGRISMVV